MFPEALLQIEQCDKLNLATVKGLVGIGGAIDNELDKTVVQVS